MNHLTTCEQAQVLRKEQTDVHSANALYLVKKTRSRTDRARHQARLGRLERIAEELSALAGRKVKNPEFARETFAVRFRVFHEPNGPVLTYSLAGPSTFPAFSSRQYDNSPSLVKALSDMRLPGREIDAGSCPDRIYIVGANQLEILKLAVPE